MTATKTRAGRDARFFSLLSYYGVPDRITGTLATHFKLPKPYASDAPPRQLPTRTQPWIYLHGPTGTGKSTMAAYLLGLFLRCRTRLGTAVMPLSLTDTDVPLPNPKYRPPRSCIHRDKRICRYVRVTELLRQMKADFSGSGDEGALLFQRCMNAEFLVLDDLTGQPSAWELNQLDLLIDKRYGDGSITIITSNHPTNRLAQAIGSERIKSRIVEIAKQTYMKKGYR